MASLNKVFLIGNLTRDVEVRVTPKGSKIGQFGLAVTRTFKDDSGTSRDETTFVDIEVWGKQAEVCEKYLAKGRQCMVEGRLKLDNWEDKETGQKRSRMKVVLENVQFLGSTGGGEKEGGSEGRYTKPEDGFRKSERKPPTQPRATDNIDEDVPF